MKFAAPAPASSSFAFLISMLLVSSITAISPRLLRQPTSNSKRYLTTEALWFNQTLDHFSPYDHRQFGQRYYEFLDNFTRDVRGPIFLKICGESACNGIPNDYISVLANKFGAAVVSLEHRYYGESSPFNSLTTENLKYLSSKQALFDLAVFRQYYQSKLTRCWWKKVGVKLVKHLPDLDYEYLLNELINGDDVFNLLSLLVSILLPCHPIHTAIVTFLPRSIYSYLDLGDKLQKTFRAFLYLQESLNLKLNRSNVENPWFVFGVSYSGALSAWFRLKFPHLTCGSLASSAVVQAIYNFTEFDKQIGISAGPECKAVLQEITHLVDQRLASNDKEVKPMFGASELKIDGDFLYYLADAAVTAFQYGNPDKLCIPLIEAKKAGEDVVKAYATYVKENYGDSVATYNQRNLKKTALTDNSGDRLWWFQVCTEVAYFQVAPSNDSIRSSRIDTRYHLDLCKNVFGEGIYPDVDATNIYYGGTRIAGSKIIFTNGSQDPWRHASKQKSSTDMPSYLISCHNCGHGTDMRGCPQSPLVPEGDDKNCSSPDAVRKVRKQITEHIDLWLSLCLDPGRSSM